MLITVTGLRLKRAWHWPRFAWHALRSMNQAKASDGCLFAGARAVDGVQHTLTVWRDRKAMLGYSRTGAHREAARIFHDIATGAVAVWESDTQPDWDQALSVWHADAREVMPLRKVATDPNQSAASGGR